MDTKEKFGSEVIGTQLNILFELIKDINNAIIAGESVRIVDNLLSVLQNNAFQHFNVQEEALKKDENYTRHCLEHYAFIKNINKLTIDFSNNRLSYDDRPALLLEVWLLDHVERFDKPFLSQQIAPSRLMDEAGGINDLKVQPTEKNKSTSSVKERRLHRRIPLNKIVYGPTRAQVYNATKLKSSNCYIVNISSGGMMLRATIPHKIDDYLIVTSSIGKNFSMTEKVLVVAVEGQNYSVKFIAASLDTIDFCSDLYGAVK